MTDPTPPTTLIFQSAKLGDAALILREFDRADALLAALPSIGRIYGVSGGALVALAVGLTLAGRADPRRWGSAAQALAEFRIFLRRARSGQIRSLNLNPWYGPFNLRPLRHWLSRRLKAYAGRDDLWLSELGLPLYLCAADHDGTLVLLGPPNEALQFQYHAVRLGPPRDARILDALIASLSTLLSTEPAWVVDRSGAGEWMRDARPMIVDAGALVADLEAGAPRTIVRTRPHAPIRPWKVNWITSSFIMHSQHERNQALLAAHYLDLLQKTRELEKRLSRSRTALPEVDSPVVRHIDLPYVGSTEAFTNMRQSAANKDALLARFREMLQGQDEGFPFDQPANVLYGAGGFSGILAGLATTRVVEAGFERQGGEIRQVFGVSAGVLNGFFHAVQLAAARHPDLYTPAARGALNDLEAFIAAVEPKRVARLNLNPFRFWKGWAHLGPMRSFFLERLAAYTGSRAAAQITFDDIDLPLTVTAARGDGFTDFLGPTVPARHLLFGGREWAPLRTPIVDALIAGWSMNTYIAPARLHGQEYRDAGGTFYDPAILIACMDLSLTNLLNIHLDEPEGHTYHLPARPNLLRLLFDTHNYTFPEERRRMRLLTDLLYEHFRLRAQRQQSTGEALEDFRQHWEVPESGAEA